MHLAIKLSNTRIICKAGGRTDCPHLRVNTLAYFWNIFGIAIESTIAFLFFGLNKKNLRLWQNFVVHRLRGTRLASVMSTGSMSESDMRFWSD